MNRGYIWVEEAERQPNIIPNTTTKSSLIRYIDDILLECDNAPGLGGEFVVCWGGEGDDKSRA